MAKTTPGEAAQALKRIRLKAGLTMPEMARIMGMKTTTYQHYEDRLKRPRLPSAFAQKVIEIFRTQGVGEDELEQLYKVSDLELDGQREVAGELRSMREEIARLREELARERGEK